MAKFFKDPDGKLIAALGNDVATPAGCTELTANTEDAAYEKHVPVVESERDGHVIRARVGSVEHPMVPEHYIEWIALEAEGPSGGPLPPARHEARDVFCRRFQDRYRLCLLQPARVVVRDVLGARPRSGYHS